MSVTTAVNVKVLPEVAVVGAVTLTVYGGASEVPIVVPSNSNTTEAMAAISLTVRVAEPLCPGDN